MTGLLRSPTPVFWHDTLDSTNAQAARVISSGTPTQCWIMAREQSQGRGRANRAWVSPQGNFMGTRLWQVGPDLSRIGLLSLAVGSVVRDAAARRSAAPDTVKTKWPNDVYIGLSKLCGILIETHKAPGGDYWAAIGIGINIALAPSLDDGRVAATLSGMETTPTADEMLSWLDDDISRLLGNWPPRSLQTFTAAWAHNAFGLGETVRLSSGQKGVFLGISNDGAARVGLDSGGETVVHAGDLTFESLEKARNASGD